MKKEDLIPETITLNDLFSYKEKYIIPGFQRPYEWDKKQIEILLKTIFEAFESSPKGALLLGTLQFNVVKDNNDNNNEIGKEIIDGHQRFTTFYLLMKYLEEEPPIKYENQIVDTKSLYELIKNNKVYKNNYQYIREYLDKYKAENSEDCFEKKLIKFLKKNIIFISINISNCKSIDETMQVFNSLNTTGLQLQVKDIFKIQYCDYLNKFSENSKEEILSEINDSYNNIRINNDTIYSLDENALLDVFRFYIMSKSKKNTWASDFRMSNSKYFENLFNKCEFDNNAKLNNFVDISCCIKQTQEFLMNNRDQEFLKNETDDDIVNGVRAFSKELIDWSGYGKLKNLYYYFVYVQYENDKKVTKEKISHAEKLMFELLKLCSVFRFTHSKIINQVFNDVGELVFKKLNKSKNAVYDFKTAYINKTIELKNAHTDRIDKFNTLFKNDGNVFLSNKPHLILAYSYIQDAENRQENISIKQIKEDLFYRKNWDLDIEHILSRTLYKDESYINSIGNLMYLKSSINKSLGTFTKNIQEEEKAKQKDFANKLEKYKNDELISVKKFIAEYKDINFIDSRNEEKINYIKKIYDYQEIFEA